MSCQASVMFGAEEVREVAAYEMETYVLTQEDHTLAVAFRLNAGLARRRPNHVVVHRAQALAACLAIRAAKYEPTSPTLPAQASHDDFCSTGFELVECCRDDSNSVHPGSHEGAPCGEGSILYSTENDTPKSQDAALKGHRWNIPTRFWKRYRQASTRVMPESDPVAMQSPQTSCARKATNSIMRGTSNEKHADAARFDSFLPVAFSRSFDGHLDIFEYPTSDDFDNADAVLPEVGDTFGGRSQSSLKCFLRKGVSRFKTVIQKGRAPASAKA
eukprot:TRINITY_DN57054_c0_g1_i1.p1 TRINITY_DN57054_c0_g1~~TRINITY_DN57054_c0_g1_i1.p1  ORF type:complete len:273 (-),score=27.83 TRINITY_DN57054_c0_g1_i1:149-967(-)